MLADVTSVIATIGFLCLIFVVTLAVCVVLLAVMAAILPSGRRSDDGEPGSRADS